MKKLLFSVLTLWSCIAYAQTGRGKISVTILNDQQSGVENATVELLRAKDSSLVKVAITDKNGLAEFENIRFGNYILKANNAGKLAQLSSSFSLSSDQTQVTIPKIILQPDAKQMGNVTVTGTKPFIQKLNDRIVVNVENSIISAGSSAMDVLERSPGVNVDQNDNISLRGRAGVIIMIDGKPTAMTGSDLA